MNFSINHIPERTKIPRNDGVTMVMDKGLSIRQVEDMISSSSKYIDIVKLGFGTAYLTENLEKKIKLYQEANFRVYFGGTLFESFIARDMFTEYKELVHRYKLDTVEVSDGCITLDHEKKCEYINQLSQNTTVLSEIGSKSADIIIPPFKWINMMERELKAGSWKVIAEAREGGNVGICRDSGEVRSDLIEEIMTQIPKEKILWEAPKKSQQVWFIKLMGHNVNLGNIAPNEVIPLESLRLGLRGDTFFEFLPKK
ncbi:MAG: phosphosulfolactate synthase [Flavobacteriales bacterium]|nr:phosphosulfolactate synthase [Flavobacteriales bacterium]|tara:strand:- start:2992 stop:3756 length:765 start_codon:yes stop_codon:yes gene_type:complete